MDASTKTKTDICEQHGVYESIAWLFGSRIMHWSKCPTCSKAIADQEAIEAEQKDAQERQQRIESRLNTAGIPLRFRSKDFSSYIADTDGKEKARSVAMEFAANFDRHYKDGTVVIFSGMPGTGKSHLAIAAAQEIMRSRSALYTSAIDVVRMIRDTWRRGAERTESQVLNDLATVDLLIMDEVGVQYGTEAEQVTLFDIIDKRYRDQMPMILLTNQNKSGMKEFLGDRSFDRLREGGIWVTFDWESQRGRAAA